MRAGLWIVGWLVCVLVGGAENEAGKRERGHLGIARLEDEVVVATTKQTQMADLPYTTYYLNPDYTKLKLQAPTLPESLRRMPGVMLQKTGHGMTSPYLRGFTSQRIVLMVDGVRLNNSFLREGPNQYWNLVDGYFHDNLELLMGPNSVLYGSDAIGGVVLAYPTPLPRGSSEEGLQWQGGQLDLRYASTEASFSEHVHGDLTLSDDWSFRVGVTRQDVGELTSGDDVENPDTNYEQYGLNLRSTYWFDADHTLTLGADWFDQDDIDRVHRTIYHQDFEGTRGKGSTSDLARTYDHDRGLVFARFSRRNGANWLEEMDLTLSYQYMREDFLRIRGDGRRNLRVTKVHTTGAALRLQSPSPVGTWVYGADYYHDFVDSYGEDTSATGVTTRRIQGVVADDADYDLLGAYVQNDLPLGEYLSLLSGLRYTYARLQADEVNLGGTEGSLDGDWEALTASLRLTGHVLPDDRLNLYTGVSQGFRAPNLSDTTRDGDFGGGTEAPTTHLDPESFTTYEIGLKSRGERWQAMLAYYYTDMEDRIGRLQQPQPTKRNLDDGYVQGIDFHTRIEVVEEWFATLNLSWMEGYEETYFGRNANRPGATRPMSRMMPLSGLVALAYEPREAPFWVEASMDWADSQETYADAEKADNRFPPGETPSYLVYNLRAGWQVRDNLDLTVGLENITDEAYRIHGSGVNEPGRNVVITAQWRF